jgi:hypothetical protein
MKLSEAIRLGAMLRPQGRIDFFSADGKSCALGAALEARGIQHRILATPAESDAIYGQLYRWWPWLRVLSIDAITYRNDVEGWTREQIADWVATIEPPEEAQSAAAATEELVEVTP